MHLTTKLVAVLLLPLLLVSAPARAQQARVVDADAMRQALAGKAESESDQRQLVRRVLSRDDVRDAAARLGLNLQQADSAVATLTGSELQRLAEQASSIESSALAGGASTVVISTTTLLLILIIVILLAN